MAKFVRKYTNYGTVEAEYNVVPDENGNDIIEGEYKKLFDDGTVSEIFYYINGKKNGQSISYFGNEDNIASMCYYIDDKLEGEYISYDEYNNIRKSCYYLNNQLHGEYKEYYAWSPYQTLYIHCFYKNGKLDGKHIEYHSPMGPNKNITGNIKRIKGDYNNNILTGYIKEYNTDNKLISIQYYNNNSLLYEFEIMDKRYNFGIDNNLENVLDEYFNTFKEHINNNPLQITPNDTLNNDDEQSDNDNDDTQSNNDEQSNNDDEQSNNDNDDTQSVYSDNDDDNDEQSNNDNDDEQSNNDDNTQSDNDNDDEQSVYSDDTDSDCEYNKEPDGNYEEYSHENQLKKKYTIKNGKLTSISKYYHWQGDGCGQLMEESKYINGKKDGLSVKYFPNGILHKSSFYINGRKEGETIIYNEKGHLVKKMNYINNFLDGKYYLYKDGKLQIECEYYQDEYMGECLVGDYINYYPNGNIKDICCYEDGKKHGSYYEYHENGRFKTEGRYEYNYKVGYEYRYDINGNLINTLFIDENND